MTLLIAEQLTKFYGLRPVLRGISLSVERNECLAVLGANGAGKTTLLRMLTTLSKPNSGTLRIDGIDAVANPDAARARIGVVSHQSLVYPDLTAFENLRFHADLQGVPHATIENALRQVDLWPRAHDLARTFSRGMIQRLTIARATLHNPALLLLDEPYTGLDQASAATLSGLLTQAASNGRAIVMTTHEFGRGLDGITRAVVIRNGRIGGEVRAGVNAASLAALVA